jgi:hypothetical protein
VCSLSQQRADDVYSCPDHFTHSAASFISLAAFEHKRQQSTIIMRCQDAHKSVTKLQFPYKAKLNFMLHIVPTTHSLIIFSCLFSVTLFSLSLLMQFAIFDVRKFSSLSLSVCRRIHQFSVLIIHSDSCFMFTLP